jgi:hypothetical membrane protein
LLSRRSAFPLLLCGAIGPPLFILASLVEGATRTGYDPIRLPVSLLSLGEFGWMQTANFIVDGVLVFLGAIGLRRGPPRPKPASTWGPFLLGTCAIGLVFAGLFPADPGGGYPPGAVPRSTTSGAVHDVASLVVFVSLAAAAFVIGRHLRLRGETGWAAYSAGTGLIVAVGFALIVIGFNGTNDITRVAGLVQRIAIIAGWSWIALLSVHEIRRSSGRTGPTLDGSAPFECNRG